MNYIEQINSFWVANEEFGFLPTDIALYFYLLKINNACNWKETFKRNNTKIMADLSISYKTLHASRQRLQKCGIISFQTKNGSPNVTYHLGKNYQGKGGGGGEVLDVVVGEVTARFGETKDKLNKTKQNKTINPPYIPPGDMYDNSENEIPDNSPKQLNGEKEKSSAKKEKEPKHKHGEYRNVLLADSEYSKLKANPEADEIINYFSQLKEMKGYKYNSDYLAIIKWGIKSYEEYKQRNGNRQLPANNTQTTGKYNYSSARNDAENKRAERANLNEMALAILRGTQSPDS